MRKNLFYRSSVKVLVISFISIYSQAFASNLSFDMKKSVQVQVIERDLLENNVLVLNFDKYGILTQKEFFSKEDMKKIKYSEMGTKNPVTQKSFVSSFLQSVRQKMYGKRKF